MHSGPKAEPKHLLQPGHMGCKQHIPTNQPAEPLSSALFSITSECTLQPQPQAGLQLTVHRSHGKGTLAPNQEGGGRHWVLLQKAQVGSTFVFHEQGKKSTTEGTLPEGTQPQTRKRYYRAGENIDRSCM